MILMSTGKADIHSWGCFWNGNSESSNVSKAKLSRHIHQVTALELKTKLNVVLKVLRVLKRTDLKIA